MDQINIRVRTADRHQLSLSVSLSNTVADVKEMLSKRTNVPPVRQRLIYQGRQLKDEEVLTNCRIAADHVLMMVVCDGRPQQPCPPPAPRALFSLELRAQQPMYRRRDPPVELSEGARLEAMFQNLLAVEMILGSRTDPSRAPEAFELSKRRFCSGQWVDALDTANQWLEAQILQVHPQPATCLVHYNGWPNRWDEWVAADSPRLQLFAARTGRSTRGYEQILSPRPRSEPSRGEFQRVDIGEMVHRAHRLLPAVARMLKRYSELKVENFMQQFFEHELEVLSIQLSTLLDRFGRLLTDLSRSTENNDAQLNTMPTQAELNELDAPRVVSWTFLNE